MVGAFFPYFGSTVSAADPHIHGDQSDEEGQQGEQGDDDTAEQAGEDVEDNIQTPLLSHHGTTWGKDMIPSVSHGSSLSMGRHGSIILGGGETVSTADIGGGWTLNYQVDEKEGPDGKKTKEFKRIFMFPKGGTASIRGSVLSVDLQGDAQAAGVVSTPSLYSKELLDQNPVGPAMVHPAETASSVPSWKALLEPGVKRALIVGIGIQILQQFSGINGVLHYTPQILEEAGVEVLLSDLGIGSTSALFLISAFITFLMLSCIAIAMTLMDISGRRTLLLVTLPMLIASLVILVIGSALSMSSVIHAVISTVCVIIYFCTFVMAYGPIPNILCSEIFPTRVRGICIAIESIK